MGVFKHLQRVKMVIKLLAGFAAMLYLLLALRYSNLSQGGVLTDDDHKVSSSDTKTMSSAQTPYIPSLSGLTVQPSPTSVLHSRLHTSQNQNKTKYAQRGPAQRAGFLTREPSERSRTVLDDDFTHNVSKMFRARISTKTMDSNLLGLEVNPAPIPFPETRLSNATEERFYNTTILRKQFHSLMSEEEKLLLQRMLSFFSQFCEKLKIPFFMYGGTLLGSYRHHNIIPWDDDMDVLVPLQARMDFLLAFNQVNSEYSLNHDFPVWKLFSNEGSKYKNQSWNFPFLDICFYDMNSTHLWDVHPAFIRDFIFLKSDVFPLTLRPFIGSFYPAPKQTHNFLAKTYNLDECSTNRYNHKYDTELNEDSVYSVPCSELKILFPFVSRTFVNGVCNETLMQNGNVLSYFVNNGSSMNECI